MTLRVRMVLAVLLTAAVTTPVLLWLAADQERRAVEQSVRSFAISMMNDFGRKSCLRRPERFVGGTMMFRNFMMPDPAKMPEEMKRQMERQRERMSRSFGARELRTSDEVWAYRADFVSDNAEAPEFPAALRKRIESGADVASAPFEKADDPREHLTVALRTEWPGEPCAFLLVRHSAPRPPGLASHREWLAAAQVGILLAAVLLACFPIVRRIRSLTCGVKESAAARYEAPIPVTGRDEIAGLARAFNEAGAEVRAHLTSIEKREQALTSFVADTTHDVMLPLTVLQGHLAEIRSGAESGKPVDPELTLACHREAAYLSSILHNLAAVAKLDGAEYRIRNDPLSLNRIVEDVVARHRTMAGAHGVGIEHSVPERDLRVCGDMILVEQAVGNVVHNAIRYNRPGGHVAVLLEPVPDEERFSLRVLDDGPGIPAADLGRVTERRFRGDAARARDPSGLGIGLHIARNVADRHGFDLAFRRSEYGGLEVEFRGRLETSVRCLAPD